MRIFNGDIYIGVENMYSGAKLIIDDVLIWCSNISFILLYFECVCRVFQKYRVIFGRISAIFYSTESNMWVVI